MPDSSTRTPASRAARQMSTVLIAAASPIGSSSIDTICGSMPTMSGAISITLSFTPNRSATIFA